MKGPSGSRSFSTSTRRRQADLHGQNAGFDDQTAAVVANMISHVDQQAAELHPGLKFEAPETLPKTENFRTRYDSLLEQFTKLLMRDGKLSKAQKVCTYGFYTLRNSFDSGHANSYSRTWPSFWTISAPPLLPSPTLSVVCSPVPRALNSP